MKHYPSNRGLAIMGILLAGLAGSSQAHAQSKGGKEGRDSGAAYGWISDYATGKAEAKRTGKPLMIVFRCVP